MQGYQVGYSDCSGGSPAPSPPPQPQPSSGFQPGYSLTVNVLSHPFGDSSVNIDITTANGVQKICNCKYSRPQPSYTFDIPPNEGNSVQELLFGLYRTWTSTWGKL
jgi:hypothetical protein